jgi:hypothetical protein
MSIWGKKQTQTKLMLSICKRCSSIRLFEVNLDFCIEDEKNKISGSGGMNAAIPFGTMMTTSYNLSQTWTSGGSGSVTWSGGYNTFTSSTIISPLVCPDCPEEECELCCIEPHENPGFMEKCKECEHRFLCGTNRLEAIRYG